MDQDREVAVLLGEGRSFRQVAGLLGLTLGGVQRAAVRARKAAEPAAADDGESVPDDPVLAALTPEDLAYLGWSAGKVAAGRVNPLERYRAEGLLWRRSQGWVPPPPGRPQAAEAMPRHVRDAKILELRAEGWSLSAIGRALVPVMSKGGVQRALSRLEDDGEVYAEEMPAAEAEEW